MIPRVLLLDTSFALALFNPADEHHDRANEWAFAIIGAKIFITEAVLTEIGNAFCRSNRVLAADFILAAKRSPNNKIISVTPELHQKAVDLYALRPDQTWGLTDCTSFIVMSENGISAALTTDRHFEQAGFEALLLHDLEH